MKNSNKNNFSQVLIAKFILYNGIPRSYLMILGILFCSLVAGLDYMSVSYVCSVRSSLERITAPLKVEAHKLIQIPKLVKSILDIKQENETLRQEIEVLKIENIKANECIQELDEIKINLNIKHNSERFNVREKVLGFEDSVYNSYLIISKTHDDVAEDSIVITSDGIVGVVRSVYEKSARVLPVTNSLMAIPVKTNSGLHLIIRGTDKNEMVAVEIQQHDAISRLTVGEILYTSGEGGFYEKDIPIAKITKVNSKEAKIHAIPVVQISDINYVYLINSNK